MRKKRMLAYVVVFMGLIGGYLILSMNPSPNEAKEIGKNDQLVIDISEEEITSILIKQPSNEISLEKKKEENGYKWKISGVEEESIDFLKTYELTSSLTHINTEAIITDNPDKLDHYGLQTPEVSVTIQKKNGDAQKLLLGDQLPTGNGYYFKIEGREIVYSVSNNVGRSFHTNQNALIVSVNQHDLSSAKFKELNVNIKGEKMMILPFENGSSHHFSSYYMAEPYQTRPQVDETGEAFGNLMAALGRTLPVETVDEEGQNLEKYGLDQPIITLSYKLIDGTSRSITIGNQMNERLYYAKIDEKPTVYSVDLGNMKELLKIRAFDLIYKTPVYTFINQVKGIEITTPNQNYKMNYKKVFKDKNSKDLSKADIEFILNGAAADEEVMRDFYLQLLELNVDAEVDSIKLDNVKAEITFHIQFEDGESTVVEYVPFQKEFYAVIIDGKNDFVIAKDKLTALLKMLEKK